MKRDADNTEPFRLEPEDSDLAPLEQLVDEATIAALREGLIVPPRPQEPTPADEDRRVAEGRPTRRSD
jgi:hypothetical protein